MRKQSKCEFQHPLPRRNEAKAAPPRRDARGEAGRHRGGWRYTGYNVATVGPVSAGRFVGGESFTVQNLSQWETTDV
jgi:hypothetical protein